MHRDSFTTIPKKKDKKLIYNKSVFMANSTNSPF